MLHALLVTLAQELLPEPYEHGSVAPERELDLLAAQAPTHLLTPVFYGREKTGFECALGAVERRRDLLHGTADASEELYLLGVNLFEWSGHAMPYLGASGSDVRRPLRLVPACRYQHFRRVVFRDTCLPRHAQSR